MPEAEIWITNKRVDRIRCRGSDNAQDSEGKMKTQHKINSEIIASRFFISTIVVISTLLITIPIYALAGCPDMQKHENKKQQ